MIFQRSSMAGEVFDRLASLGPIEIHWIFLIFLHFGQARPEAWRSGSRWISIKFLWKNLGKLKRDHESEGNRHKIMHTSAKHYFEVVWTHLGAFRAVESRFSWFSMVLQRFGSPGRPSLPWAARGQLSCRRAVSERGFGRFYKLWARIWKIL